MERASESGFPVDPVYDASKLTDFQPETQRGRPGEYPFTRGAYPRMYVDRPSTMRQYAGFATASESSRRCRELTEAGKVGVAVDAVAAAIERGFRKAEIESAACQVAREIDEGDRIVVGASKFAPVLYPLRDALRADATLGEVSDALRDVWGEYHPSEM